MPLHLTEAEVASLLTPADAVETVEECFRRMAAGDVANRPRYRLPLERGMLAVMSAADTGIGYAGAKVYSGFATGAAFALVLFRTDRPELVAVLAADELGRLRTGAATGVAAKHLARPDATTLGVIGAGWQAETQIAAVRAAVPTVERVVVHARTRETLEAFCERVGAEPAESHAEAGAQEIVVTITTSKDPVLRGDWLRPGALVCAAGANHPAKRELDNQVLGRAAFVCCDSIDDAKVESGDLIDPVAAGVLDWLEVHELQEVVAGTVTGRADPEDVVVFKSNGLAAWDVALAAVAVERARERGVGRELPV